MSYVLCVNNAPYIHIAGEPEQTEPLLSLTVGKVYKALPDPLAERHGDIRVIDESYGEAGSEGGYLYPADYFQPFVPNGNQRMTAAITVHLDEFTRGVLNAEAVAANMSVSRLIREWIEERLDLPSPV
ncbi:MAG: hypothetical protein KJZ86_18295 [Caldilineaceae bacterium]|nr:hypothetical protein [Caldilineaceae bacterium]HRJ43285.1 hypothetical protein [Caldilineaceae bacterium]